MIARAWLDEHFAKLGRRVTSVRDFGNKLVIETESLTAKPAEAPHAEVRPSDVMVKKLVHKLVQAAKGIAIELCIVRGATDGHDVYAEVRRRGLHVEAERLGLKTRTWLGQVFTGHPHLVKAGFVVKGDATRNVNATNVQRWKLRPSFPEHTWKVQSDIPTIATQETLDV